MGKIKAFFLIVGCTMAFGLTTCSKKPEDIVMCYYCNKDYYFQGDFVPAYKTFCFEGKFNNVEAAARSQVCVVYGGVTFAYYVKE